MTIAGVSDEAHGDQSTTGKCRPGFVIGLISSTLRGPCRIFQWAAEYIYKLVTNSLGGEVRAFS